MSEDLLAAAAAAREHAYAPYSGFTMGAVVRTRSGRVMPGALVENVSLGLAMCAERVALHACVPAGERPAELALVSERTSGGLTWPCGACLQVALELGGPDLVVHVAEPSPNGTGERDSATLRELLPNGPLTPVARRASAS